MAIEPIIQPQIEPIPDLFIGTSVCPHCGSERESVVKRSGGISRCITARWEVRWECGSSVMLAGQRARISLSKRCNPGLEM